MSRPGVFFLEARTRSALTNIPSCVGDDECPSPELTSAWTFDGEAMGSLSQTRPVGPRHELFGNNGTPVSVFLQQLGRHDVWTCARRKRRLVVCVQGANRCNQPFGARSCALGSPVAEVTGLASGREANNGCMSSQRFLRVLLSGDGPCRGNFAVSLYISNILTVHVVTVDGMDGRVAHSTASIGTSVRRHGQGYPSIAGALL